MSNAIRLMMVCVLLSAFIYALWPRDDPSTSSEPRLDSIDTIVPPCLNPLQRMGSTRRPDEHERRPVGGRTPSTVTLLGGIVCDPLDRPVSGVTVRILRSPPFSARLEPVGIETTSDMQGRWSFELPDIEEFTRLSIVGEKEGHRSGQSRVGVRPGDHQDAIRVAVRPVYPLEVRVFEPDGESPVVGLDVVVACTPTLGASGELTGITDSLGTCVFEVPDMVLSVFGVIQDTCWFGRQVPSLPESRTVDVVMPAPVRRVKVCIRVHGHAQEPIRGRLVAPHGDTPFPVPRDASSSLQAILYDEGPIQLHVDAGELAWTWCWDSLSEAAPRGTINVSLEELVEHRVQLLTRDLQPLPGLRIRLVSAESGASRSDLTNASGMATFHASPGTYSVRWQRLELGRAELRHGHPSTTTHEVPDVGLLTITPRRHPPSFLRFAVRVRLDGPPATRASSRLPDQVTVPVPHDRSATRIAVPWRRGAQVSVQAWSLAAKAPCGPRMSVRVGDDVRVVLADTLPGPLRVIPMCGPRRLDGGWLHLTDPKSDGESRRERLLDPSTATAFVDPATGEAHFAAVASGRYDAYYQAYPGAEPILVGMKRLVVGAQTDRVIVEFSAK